MTYAEQAIQMEDPRRHQKVVQHYPGTIAEQLVFEDSSELHRAEGHVLGQWYLPLAGHPVTFSPAGATLWVAWQDSRHVMVAYTSLQTIKQHLGIDTPHRPWPDWRAARA